RRRDRVICGYLPSLLEAQSSGVDFPRLPHVNRSSIIRSRPDQKATRPKCVARHVAYDIELIQMGQVKPAFPERTQRARQFFSKVGVACVIDRFARLFT